MASSAPFRRLPRRVVVLAVGGLIAASGALPAFAAAPPAGTLTTRNSMLDVLTPGGWTKPIITVGESVGGYTFEAIPDGISVFNKHGSMVEVFVNHETSTVPFPLQANGSGWMPTTNTTTGGTTPGTQNDYTNSLLSHLVVNRVTGGVISGEYAIGSGANFQRFCSQTLANGNQKGFSRPLLFLNEEATDFVSRTGQAYPILPATEPPHSQAGYVVAYDPQNGQYKTVPGMGRTNHENSVAIPGYHKPVLLTSDDTFVSNPPESQLYMYVANTADAVWNDQGSLYTFRATNYSTYNDYYDFSPAGTGLNITGEFTSISHSTAIGPQAALESASDAANAFQFVRLEDIAYDRNDPHIVYIADTGRANAAATNGVASTNGRIWRMVLNAKDPLKVDSLSILYDGDLVGLGQVNVIHQPDNLETTPNYLYVTEDPSTANQIVSYGRIWRIALTGVNYGTAQIAAQVDQSYDGDTSIDKDGFVAVANPGYWESSGIIDVSDVFGEGTFLVTIQAHSLWVGMQAGPDNWTRSAGAWTAGPDTYPDWMLKREGGQLILVKIPGG